LLPVALDFYQNTKQKQVYLHVYGAPTLN